MNIEVVGRIRPFIRAEGTENIVIEGQRIAASSKGPFLNFVTLHKKNARNSDVFKHSIEDLVGKLLEGYNVCLLVLGETESGKTYTIAGESNEKAGVVPMILDHVFSKLTEVKFVSSQVYKNHPPTVNLEMYEIYNELIKDLLQDSTTGTVYLDLMETPNEGIHVHKGTRKTVSNISEAVAKFREGMSRLTTSKTDFGPASSNASLIIHINVQMIVEGTVQPSICTFSVIKFPGMEKLSEDPAELRQKEGPGSKSLIALNSVVTSLAQNPFPDRVINYSDSKLTALVSNELGGNFKSKALLCLKPQTSNKTLTAALTFCTKLGQVKNFPIVNNAFASGLLTLHRARMLDLKHQIGAGPAPLTKVASLNDIRDKMSDLETENVNLRDENERLRGRLDSTKSKLGSIANTKTDLSHQLLNTEEEKLKVSQSLIELQIENNRIQEEAEAAKFELENQVLVLENKLQDCSQEKDKYLRESERATARVLDMEKDRKDLSDEFVILRKTYLECKEKADKEQKKNEELSMELLNLVNAKAILMKKVVESGDSSLGDADTEIKRVTEMIKRQSPVTKKTEAEEHESDERTKVKMKDALYDLRKRHEKEIDRFKKDNEGELNRLDKKIHQLQKELEESRDLNRARQKALSELNAKYLTTKAENEDLTSQINRLQHKTKTLGEEYRSRLVKYVEDISEYVDKGGKTPDEKTRAKLREQTENMIKELSKSHKEREEQLSTTAQQAMVSRGKVFKAYEELLVHYRNLRLLCEERGFSQLDLGPDETSLTMSDNDIVSSQLNEIARLKSELNKARQMSEQRGKVLFADKEKQDMSKSSEDKTPRDNWQSLRKKLREYTLNTQRELEEERAKLKSENEALKGEVRELQRYIDQYLTRLNRDGYARGPQGGYGPGGGGGGGGPYGSLNERGRRKYHRY